MASRIRRVRESFVKKIILRKSVRLISDNVIRLSFSPVSRGEEKGMERDGGRTVRKMICAIFQASPLIKNKPVINANWMTPISAIATSSRGMRSRCFASRYIF